METVTLHPPAGFSLRLLSPARNPDHAAAAVSAEEEDSGLDGSQEGKANGSSASDAALLDGWDDPEMARAQSADKASHQVPPTQSQPRR